MLLMLSTRRPTNFAPSGFHTQTLSKNPTRVDPTWRFITNLHRSKDNASFCTKASRNTDIDIPSSRDDAVKQACAAIVTALNDGPDRPESQNSCRLLSIDIPVMDDSPRAQAQLSTELLGGLPAAWQKKAIVFVSDDHTQQERQGPNQKSSKTVDPVTKSAAEASRTVEDLGDTKSVFIFSAPQVSDLVHINALLEMESKAKWLENAAVVVVNAPWNGISDGGPSLPSLTNGLMSAYHSMLDSFQPAYAFIPVSVKTFMVTAYEGAVVYNIDSLVNMKRTGRRSKKKEKRSSGDGFGGKSLDRVREEEDDAERPWKVYLHRNRQTWELVARMKNRPTQKDLEDEFYNVAATAMASPFAAGAKFLRNLTGK